MLSKVSTLDFNVTTGRYDVRSVGVTQALPFKEQRMRIARIDRCRRQLLPRLRRRRYRAHMELGGSLPMRRVVSA
jgi:hypothetical protein